jgi:cytochrome c biogenesis protein CcmG/thiol:disulfide interchange protein DsbE
VKILGALLLAASATGGLATVHIGAPPPDFTFRTKQGIVQLARLRGKPVVINFWASWCPPCTDELPLFQRLSRDYGDRVVLVTVSNEAAGVARDYLREHRLDLPLLEDSGGAVFSAYAIPPIPGTVVLDAEGKVQYISAGGLSWDELQGAVDKALGSPGPGTPAPRLLR